MLNIAGYCVILQDIVIYFKILCVIMKDIMLYIAGYCVILQDIVIYCRISCRIFQGIMLNIAGYRVVRARIADVRGGVTQHALIVPYWRAVWLSVPVGGRYDGRSARSPPRHHRIYTTSTVRRRYVS